MEVFDTSKTIDNRSTDAVQTLYSEDCVHVEDFDRSGKLNQGSTNSAQTSYYEYDVNVEVWDKPANLDNGRESRARTQRLQFGCICKHPSGTVGDFSLPFRDVCGVICQLMIPALVFLSHLMCLFLSSEGLRNAAPIQAYSSVPY